MWHIVGNGQGKLALNEHDKVIRFNQPLTCHVKTQLTITNSKLSGVEQNFLICGKTPGTDFSKKLEFNSLELERQLGNKPSLGFLTIMTMLEYGEPIRVSRMDLLPSLIRPSDYPHRKALPAAYHNWLGERRFAFSRLEQLDWPEFWLKVDSGGKSEFFPSFSELLELPTRSRKEGRHLWHEFSNISNQKWLKQADYEKLKSIEPLFYLSRNEKNTSNWWMYDNQLSISVSRLQRILALVQQRIYQNKKEKA
ncbi:hypothetical protein [Thiomicrorhabdus xiamenensis]|uniref:Uncharacterized protein n=1 Tax=Thiomicrorhabdus xiamenensis TaxID=2739063 RepID=A0A7D4NZA8_9GAMM|nr:hypothetical protein [Thiomicrorhabdus xiamenensis]QKI89638.1 hypothetical protein HQN79_08685 [Thiomicrorhabdus xiamenensis]